MNRIVCMIFIILNFVQVSVAEQIKPTINSDVNVNKEQTLEEREGRVLEKTYTILMEEKVNIFVPLEIISDVDIEATLIGDQSLEIPFEIELNKQPEKKDYYSIKYSESAIDIDKDGKLDTYIYSPQYINERVIKDNYIKIYGDKISKEGQHKKSVYMEVEVGY